VPVYDCSRCGFRCILYLDDEQRPDADPLTDEVREYISSQLHSNHARFPSKIEDLERFLDLATSRCIDIGAGAGLFLHLIASRGATVDGVEPSLARRQYAAETYGLPLRSGTIATAVGDDDLGAFDLVTAWDVLEHVNDPWAFLEQAVALLRPNGLLALDTPDRRGNLYRMGELEYRLTFGRSGRVLGAMYSASPFGHKQILTQAQVRERLAELGCQPILLKRITELSFPARFYLDKMSWATPASLAKVLDRAARRLPLGNKMLGIFAKTA
jgi:2-polyprenyl-6-hydroxyphenyl methylase/3-demethylubiquinone-9 3-methyltransferase